MENFPILWYNNNQSNNVQLSCKIHPDSIPPRWYGIKAILSHHHPLSAMPTPAVTSKF
jgi:hypothetical protein